MGGSRKSAPGGQGRVRGRAGGGKWTRAPYARAEANKAPKAPRVVGLGEGVSPSPMGRGLGFGEGSVPPLEKIFEFLISNWRIFMGFESIM